MIYASLVEDVFSIDNDTVNRIKRELQCYGLCQHASFRIGQLDFHYAFVNEGGEGESYECV